MVCGAANAREAAIEYLSSREECDVFSMKDRNNSLMQHHCY